MAINLRKITQGERGTLTFTWEFPEVLTIPASILGETITATMTDEDGVTTAVSGTLTGTAATTCTWALSAGDSGTPGTFTVVFQAIVTGVTTYTLEATLEVIANPAVTGTQNDPLVSISAANAAWVTLAATAVPDGGDVVDANDLGTAAAANAGDFDAAGAAATAQAAAIAALGGADGTVSDEQLRNWAGQLPGLMTSVTRTDYSKSWTGTDGRTKYAGWVQITGTVTWPDGVTGHVDGVEYPEEPGVLQYFTASHVASGKIVVQSPLVDGVAGYTVVTPDWYVDSAAVAGGDGSLAAPFDTISDLSLTAGDVVALKSGSEFSENLKLPDNAKALRYGAGAKPKLIAYDILAAGAWSAAAGTATYQASITYEGQESGVSTWVSAWEDGVMLAYGSGAATLTAGQYFVSDHSAGTATLYVRASDDGDLSAGSSIIWHGARHGGLDSTSASSPGNPSDNVTVDGLHCIGNTNMGGSIKLGRSAIIRHCVAEDGNSHNIYTEDGAELRGVIMDNAYHNASFTLYVFNENTAAGFGITLDSCALLMDAWILQVSGPYGHVNTSGGFGAITYNRLYGKNLQNGITALNAAHITSLTVSDCYMLNCAQSYNVTTNATFRNCTLYSNFATNVRGLVIGAAVTVRWLGGWMSFAAAAAGSIGVYSTQACNATVLNTIIKRPSWNGATRGINVSNAGAVLVQSGNIYSTYWSNYVRMDTRSAYYANVNNYEADGATSFSFASTNYTLAAYQAALAADIAAWIGGVDLSALP